MTKQLAACAPRLLPGWGWLVLLLLLGLFSAGYAGETATLAWDADQDPNVAGYYLYYGTASGVYTGSVNAARNTTATLTDLAPGTAYFCVVIAYTAEGQQSAPSNEASFTTAPRARAPRPAGPGAPEPVSPPAVINAMQRLPNGSFQLTLTTPGNSLAGVSIYASSDLKTWTLLGSLPNSTLPFTVTDPEAAFFDRRFYRFSSP